MMDSQRRNAIARDLNALSRRSRRIGAPTLAADSTRETLLDWLDWNDPGGCYTDAARAADAQFSDGEPLTISDAWVELLAVGLTA